MALYGCAIKQVDLLHMQMRNLLKKRNNSPITSACKDSSIVVPTPNIFSSKSSPNISIVVICVLVVVGFSQSKETIKRGNENFGIILKRLIKLHSHVPPSSPQHTKPWNMDSMWWQACCKHAMHQKTSKTPKKIWSPL